LKELELELKHKTFLEGEGFALGAKDKVSYEIVKEKHVDKDRYPNVFRWFKFIEKSLE